MVALVGFEPTLYRFSYYYSFHYYDKRICSLDYAFAISYELGRDHLVSTHLCLTNSNTSWIDKLIHLELEHIDGNYYNNKLENLTLL